MDDYNIFEMISKAKKDFGVKCAKFTGAVTVEVIKYALEKHGIFTSPRDVFIKNLPIEIDLLIPKTGAVPEYDAIYDPNDVLVVLEIKNYGSFGEKPLTMLRKTSKELVN